MSIVLSLTSAAIVVGATLSTATVAAVISGVSKEDVDIQAGIETMFVDAELLIKTLNNHGCCVDVVSDNNIVVKTSSGNLRYFRETVGEPYKMILDEITDTQKLLNELKEFEFDYGKNVQAYTYNHIKENLTSDMTIRSEEILEDDSVVLTISVD